MNDILELDLPIMAEQLQLMHMGLYETIVIRYDKLHYVFPEAYWRDSNVLLGKA